MSEETLTESKEDSEPLWKKYQRAITEHEEWIVETLVVVDKIMYYKHGKDNITTFTLTLFNMVRADHVFLKTLDEQGTTCKCIQIINIINTCFI